MNQLRRELLEADVRGLALFRIAFGLVLAAYLFECATPSIATMFYTDLGVLPRTWLFRSPEDVVQFSLFFASGEPAAIVVLLGIGVVAAIAFTLGYRTRVAILVVAVLLASLATRNPFARNSAHAAMQILSFFAFALPLDARYSIDARRGVADVVRADRVTTIGVLAFRLQVAAIYLLGALQKSGGAWRDGSAIHFVLENDTFARDWVRAVRSDLPPMLTRGASYSTIAIEIAIAVLVLSPLFPKLARRVACVLLVVLHLGIGATLALGPFSAVMLCVPILLASSGDFGWLDARLAKAGVLKDARVDATQTPASSSKISRFAREGYFILLFVVLCTLVRTDPPLVGRTFGVVGAPAPIAAFRAFFVFEEAWGLFAPDVESVVTRLVVEIEMRDGRHLDPFTRARPALRSTVRSGRVRDHRFVGYEATLLRKIHDRAFVDGLLDYACRLPLLERWSGDRAVRAVRIHLVRRAIARPGLPRVREVTSEVIVERLAGAQTIVRAPN